MSPSMYPAEEPREVEVCLPMVLAVQQYGELVQRVTVHPSGGVTVELVGGYVVMYRRDGLRVRTGYLVTFSSVWAGFRYRVRRATATLSSWLYL